MKDNKDILNDMKPLTDEELTNVCGGLTQEEFVTDMAEVVSGVWNPGDVTVKRQTINQSDKMNVKFFNRNR